ncbi:MAG: LTA synthase family protein [Acholeplasmataceae bacterium]|nr:LTA synthase family protein [Acholeplasmataceae bacterium]
MKNRNQSQIYFFYVGAFFLLNILNTYMLTVQGLNRYIAPFKHTFLGEINAILGNFSILLAIVLVAFILIRKAKGRMLFLLLFTLFLNGFIFLMSIFNLYFGTAFSIESLSLLRNPSDALAHGTYQQVLLELFTYWRIVIFLPTIALLVFYLTSNLKEMKIIYFHVPLKAYLSGFLSSILIIFVAVFSYYQQFKATLPIYAVRSTFAVQNLGVYPYYFGEIFGNSFSIDMQSFLELDSDEDLAAAYQYYNKNQAAYLNFFDQNIYSNQLNLDQAVDNLYVDPSIALGSGLNGILEDRNLVVIHIESMNHFLFENQYTNERLSFINNLFEQSFVFSNFYNNVGMGVSSDAELAVLSGLYPVGDRILYWEDENTNYDLNTLVKYFNLEEYYTEAIHGDYKTFYNREYVYPNMMGFDDFYSLEDFISDGYVIEQGFEYDTENNLVHHNPWVSDYFLADTVSQKGNAYLSANTPFMLFPIMMMPHTPFDYDPNGERTDVYPQYVNEIQNLTLKYLNYTDYYDDTLKRFFIDEENQDQTLDNTVYLFYSDHGSGLKNGDLNTLFDRDLSIMESRQILQQTVSFLYVPGNSYVDYGDYQIRKGLLTGEQNLVRSEVDLYRTIIDLFNLPIGSDPYFGVNGLSKEPTFAMSNRLMDVVTDDIFYSMRNSEKTFPENGVVSQELYDYIVRSKMLSDLMISNATMQNQIDELIKEFYG